MAVGVQVSASGHLLLAAIPAWGHLKPLSAFACKVVQERPDIAITLLTVGDFRQRAEAEIDRYFSGEETSSKGNIRLVSLGGEGFDRQHLMPLMFGGFQDFYKALINGESVQCNGTGKTYDAIRVPNVAVIDFFAFSISQTIRSVTDKTIPVFIWAPASASVLLRLFGPESLGGLGDVERKARTEAGTTGRSLEEISRELYRPSQGKLVTVPGLPLMYDYEWSPQEPWSDVSQNLFFSTAYTFFRECDGVISTTSKVLEAESIAGIRGWLAETNRQFFTIGPLITPESGVSGDSRSVGQTDLDLSGSEGVFQVFLDKMLKSYGENSLIYISFGSIWWPKNEYVWVFVNTLLELGVPFIMSHPSSRAVVPPGFAEKVEESGRGLLTAWSPQQIILNHAVTGWFATHCGQNSVLEALTQGVPMIAWPLDADQPANAAYLTLTLDVAFELIEGRTGLGLKPLHRGVQPVGTVEALAAEARNVLQRARGPEGERKRRNAKNMSGNLRGEWEAGGNSLGDLRHLLIGLIPAK